MLSTTTSGFLPSCTIFTDAGLVHLKGLTKLKVLNLQGNKVTDAGLAHLECLTGLTSLNLDVTC